MTLKTRQPTRRTGWPRPLISGGDKCGKSWSIAQLSASPKVGRTVVIVLGEDESRWDEYGLIDGARFELAVWDGTWRSLMETVEAAKDEAAKAVANGEPPFVLAIDTMTAVWEACKDWAGQRARNSTENKRKLAADPDAEIVITPNYWNDAHARHRQLMRVLLTFPGPVVMICRGKYVTEFQNGQPQSGPKIWSVESENNLPFDASAHVQLARGERAKLVSASGVHVQIRPGEDPPERLPSDWSLEWLLFDRFKLDPAQAAVGGFTEMQPDLTPEQIRDEAVELWTPSARILELYDAAKAARYAMAMPNEDGKDELLSAMLGRIGAARKKARAALDPEDSWLPAIDGMSIPEDAEKIRAELDEAFAKVPASDLRLMGLREAYSAKVREITAAADGRAA